MRGLFLPFALILSFTMVSKAQFRFDLAGDARIDGQVNIFEDANVFGRLSFPNFSVYIGDQSRFNDDDAFFNTFLGYRTGRLNEASGNTFIGANSGQQNTEGTRNTFAGQNSGSDNMDGDDNTFVGNSSGREYTP